MENWKTYIEGYYEASTEGAIRSVDRLVDFNGTLAVRRGVLLKPTLNSKGYLTVVICVNGSRRTESVHRIISKTFLKNAEDLPEVNHINGDVLDNSLDNLEWISREDNLLHAAQCGFVSAGNCKLTEDEVSQIKLLIKKGLSNPRIGELFGIDRATIRNIRIGKSWTHVKMAVESLA